MKNEVCIEDCSPYFYGDYKTQSCKVCHTSCKNCIGPSLDLCTECESDKALIIITGNYGTCGNCTKG